MNKGAKRSSEGEIKIRSVLKMHQAFLVFSRCVAPNSVVFLGSGILKADQTEVCVGVAEDLLRK